MIYLDDSTEENGCLAIVPGSHRWGPRNHLFAKDGAFSSQLEDKSVLADSSRWLKVPVPAGGMELHHCNMLHSSTANRGTRPRSAMVIQYRGVGRQHGQPRLRDDGAGRESLNRAHDGRDLQAPGPDQRSASAQRLSA